MYQNIMNRNNHGFTLIEVTVVLVLISIIAAAVFARSISTDQIKVVGEVDKIRNHIRYAQSLAMKRGEEMGVKCDGLSPGRYWMFSGVDPDNQSNQHMLPGETAVKVSLPDSISMSPFTVIFDKYGIPQGADNSPLSSELTITISGSPHNLTITPETGFIITQ